GHLPPRRRGVRRAGEAADRVSARIRARTAGHPEAVGPLAGRSPGPRGDDHPPHAAGADRGRARPDAQPNGSAYRPERRVSEEAPGLVPPDSDDGTFLEESRVTAAHALRDVVHAFVRAQPEEDAYDEIRTMAEAPVARLDA